MTTALALPPMPSVASRTRSGAVDPEAAERIARDEAALKASGFDFPPPLYAAGTPLIQLGVDNWRRERSDWEALPRAHDALTALSEAIYAEHRSNATVTARDIRMTPEGDLLLPSGQTVGTTPRGFDTLSRRILGTPRGFASYVKDCPPALRAANLNHWLPQQEADRRLVVRSRDNRAGADDGRHAFAVVTPHYTPYDANVISGMLGDPSVALLSGDFDGLVRPDDRAEVLYEDARASLNIVRFSDVAATKAAAGEFFKAAVGIKTADDGSGGIQVYAKVWRNLCLNLIVVRTSRIVVDSIPHMGDRASIISRFARAMHGALERIECFGGQYDAALRDDIREEVNGFTVATPVEDVVRWLFAEQQKMLGTTLNPNLVARAVEAAWQKEPSYSRAGLVNAISRAAHEASWGSPWVTEELEEVAGRLLAADHVPYGAMTEAEYEEREKKVRARKLAASEPTLDEA